MSERTNALLGRLRQLSQAYYDDAKIFTLGDIDEFLTKFEELDHTMRNGEEWPSEWRATYMARRLDAAEADMRVLEDVNKRQAQRLGVEATFRNTVNEALDRRHRAMGQLIDDGVREARDA